MPGAAAAIGMSGSRKPLLFDLPDDVDFPRLLELGCFLDFVWADPLLVVAVVSPDVVVVVVDDDLADDELLDLPVVEDVLDLPVVEVVDGLRVVAVVDEDEELLDDELDAVVADDDDDDVCDEASVIWILRCPSLDSMFPSVTTKLKSSTSTPDGAW